MVVGPIQIFIQFNDKTLEERGKLALWFIRVVRDIFGILKNKVQMVTLQNIEYGNDDNFTGKMESAAHVYLIQQATFNSQFP